MEEELVLPRLHRALVALQPQRGPLFAHVLGQAAAVCGGGRHQQLIDAARGERLQHALRPLRRGGQQGLAMHRLEHAAQARDALVRRIAPGIGDQADVVVVGDRGRAREAGAQLAEDPFFRIHGGFAPGVVHCAPRCSRASSCRLRAAGFGALR